MEVKPASNVLAAVDRARDVLEMRKKRFPQQKNITVRSAKSERVVQDGYGPAK